MPCHALGCTLDASLATEPCVVCKRGVHHICSNTFYDGELSKRFCSEVCVAAHSNDEASTDGITSTEACGSASNPEPIDVDVESSSSSATVTPMPAATSSSDDGRLTKSLIPDSVAHSVSTGTRHGVWDLIHELAMPFMEGGEPYSHLCLLCVEEASRCRTVTKDSWKKGLRKIGNVSNAKLHIQRMHKDHPMARAFQAASTAKGAARMKRLSEDSTTFVGTSEAKSDKDVAKRICPGFGDSKSAYASKQPISTYFRPSRKTMNVALAEWLMNDGIPFNIVTTPAFKHMLRTVSGNESLLPLARDTYNEAIDGRFHNFCKAVSCLLAYQHDRLYGMRFLTLIHDAWTGNKRTGVIGASVAFIDHQWTFRHIALMATVKNDGHSSVDVSRLIDAQCIKHYSLDLATMIRWTMSDTTASARGVAAYFEESDQEDCKMHILSLCIAYGIGLKDNVKTTKATDGSGASKREIVTPGGPLPEGAEVVRKLRALNNYFCTPKRSNKLDKVQEAHGLPRIKPLVDVDVRVASTCSLMRRSIENYTAMKMCFMDQDVPNVFSVLTNDDWSLIREMEAVTQQLAELARSEVQSQSLVSSYMLVYRTMATAHLKSRSYQCLVLSPAGSTLSDRRQRESVLAENFTEHGQVCIARCQAQVRNRFPELSKSEVVALLLDPRTKNCAGDIIDGMDYANAQRDRLLSEAMELILSEYIKFEELRHAKKAASSPMDTPSPPLLPHISPASAAATNAGLLFGAPVPMRTKEGIHQNRLKEEAASALRQWMDHQEDWTTVALAQNLGNDHTAMSRELCFRRDDDAICWNIFALSRIDILRWFREVGQTRFPTISTLARIWLGRVSSTAFQERVFSTAGVVMSNKRTRTDNERAEKLLLLRVNRKEVQS